VFSELARQQSYEKSYYQQPITSANTMFSYSPIQQQSYEEPSYINHGSSSTSTVPGSTYDDCLMLSFLHQHNSYQLMETPQTVPVLSTSLPLTHGNFFSALDTRRSHWHKRNCSACLDIRLQTLLKSMERQIVKVVSWNHNLFLKVLSRDGFKNRLFS
jgi:hypothetical protein